MEIHPTAVVCKKATIEGDVRIGQGTVVQPYAVIRATAGPIVIGDENIIEECVHIENLSTEPLVIGNDNVFEVQSKVFASGVGNNNHLGVQCEVAEGVAVGNGCSIGVRCRVVQKGPLSDRTAIYGDNQRRVSKENPPSQSNQLEVLRKILPSYHYLHNKKAAAGN